MDYAIVNERTGQVIATRAELLDSTWSRMKGLLGRSSLPLDEAVIIRPCFSIHTAFMRFPLDVIFLDRGGRVLKLAPNVRPFRLASRLGAHDAVEMAAGALAAADIEVGDRVDLRPKPA